jgi:hypothetical protein
MAALQAALLKIVVTKQTNSGKSINYSIIYYCTHYVRGTLGR